MGLDKKLVRAIRELDEYELRRLVIYAQDLLKTSDESFAESHPTPVRVRSQRVRCGKDGCAKCPHGPYWYAYWREGGRARSKYLGKVLPQEYRS